MKRKPLPPTPLGRWAEKERYSQQELAKKLGVTPSYLSLLVNGLRVPSLGLAVKIADLTGIPEAKLLLKQQEQSR